MDSNPHPFKSGSVLRSRTARRAAPRESFSHCQKKPSLFTQGFYFALNSSCRPLSLYGKISKQRRASHYDQHPFHLPRQYYKIASKSLILKGLIVYTPVTYTQFTHFALNMDNRPMVYTSAFFFSGELKAEKTLSAGRPYRTILDNRRR